LRTWNPAKARAISAGRKYMANRLNTLTRAIATRAYVSGRLRGWRRWVTNAPAATRAGRRAKIGITGP
jgi:hypothetical protein